VNIDFSFLELWTIKRATHFRDTG